MKYYALHLEDGVPPAVLEFESSDKLVSWYKDNDPSSGHLLIFKGERLFMTAGPFRYLVEDTNQFIPLFNSPSPGPISSATSLDDLKAPVKEDALYAHLTPPFESEDKE